MFLKKETSADNFQAQNDSPNELATTVEISHDEQQSALKGGVGQYNSRYTYVKF